MFATSSDGAQIYYEVTGHGPSTLVFVHGWMGNLRWWDAQCAAFANDHRVVTLDLAGHGRSTRSRAAWTADAYAADIVAVVRAVTSSAEPQRVVLIGHSMAGAFATVASPAIDHLAALVLVDTLKDLDMMPPREQIDAMLASYRADYGTAVATLLPRFLFAPRTPPAVIERLTREFLAVTGDVAAALIEPLYRLDARAAARAVTVPVRGIGTDLHPSNVDANRVYFRDYGYVAIEGYGHYPMLEAPDAFDAALRRELVRLCP